VSVGASAVPPERRQDRRRRTTQSLVVVADVDAVDALERESG
jgi:hypothetical protein